MKLLDRAANAIMKNVPGMIAGNAISPSTLYRGGFGMRDYSEPVNAQNAYMAVSSIFGCVTAYATNAPQITMKVQHLDGEPWPDHPAQWLIQHPNDDMGERIFSLYCSIYKPLGGAVFLHKLRSEKTNQIIGWRPYSTAEIAPVPVVDKPIGRNSWIDYYYHTPLVGAPQRMERTDVMAFRFPSIHPIYPQMNLSPLAAIFLDVAQDKAVTKLPTDLMQHGAFASLVIMLGQGAEKMTDAELTNVRADIAQGWTGDNRFNPMTVRSGGSITDMIPDFRKMDWAKLGERPELRICSALRVPIRYMGFSAGIDASTSDNYIGSWISFVKDAVMSQAQLDADTLTDELVRESWQNHPTVAYGMDRSATSAFKVAPDTTEVLALKTEQILIAEAAGKSYDRGAITKDEYRATLGKKPAADGTGGSYGVAKSTNPFDKTTTVTDQPNTSQR